MERPTIKRIPHQVFFGKMDGVFRGENAMFPGIYREDNYFWLRNKESQEVLDVLHKENDYTRFIMNGQESTQNNLYQELLSNVKEDYDSLPLPQSHLKEGWKSKYYYFSRTLTGKSYHLHCRVNMENNEEEILLDENNLAFEKKSFHLKSFRVNEEQKLMSYCVDYNGSENYNLVIQSIKTKENILHSIPNLMYGGYEWYQNSIYYLQGNNENRIHQLWNYDFYTKEHVKIYEETEELYSLGFSVGEDNRYLFLHSDSVESSKVFYFTHENKNIKQVTDFRQGHKYEVSVYQNRLFILTNKDDAKNFKIMECELENTNEENWIEYMPYESSIYIEGMVILKDYLILSVKKNGNSYIWVIPHELKKKNYWIDAEGEIINLSLMRLFYNSNIIFYCQTSLKTPVTCHRLNLDTREGNIIRVKEIPNFDSSLYRVERIYTKENKVPMSIIYRKDMFQKDGSNPIYLYGYGSYGITIDPTFRASILPLLNRGFVYAIAHVRGGSFLGYEWFEEGKMLKKMNTFQDFIACAEHLKQENYGDKITIEGRSAGGLIVGAAVTMRPDLFHCVIAGVPFVDVMNTMCDPSIPLTIPEWEQWGNPNEKKYYDYILQYSPYDNVRQEKYPHILALAGLNDPRVAYWEPAKWIAKLREFNENPKSMLLLKTEMQQGHFGQADRYGYLKELAFDYSFVIYSQTI